MSFLLDRQKAVTPGNQARRARILAVAGAVAFAIVVAGWAVYDTRRSSGWTLYPVDLGVYRAGGLIVRHVSPPYDPGLAHPLYDWGAGTTLQFTYTPFAAVVFAAVSYLPAFLDSRLEEAVNLVVLAAACWFTMRALGHSGRRMRLGGALLGAAAGLLTEPVFRTIYLGQINLVLMAMIIWDLTPGASGGRGRWRGVLTGVAAGIKLVPLIFVPYLLLTRRFREALLAVAGFAFTIGLGFAVVPRDSYDFWFNGLFFADGRTGFVGWGGNQSLRGIVTRLAGSISAGTVPWLAACLVVTAAGLLAAAALHRSGHAMLGLLTAALVGLLDSPISWDHHWVWVVPGMMAAGHYAVVAWRSLRRWRAVLCAGAAATLLLVFFPWPGRLWSLRTTGPGNFTWGLIWAAPDSKVTYYMQHGDRSWFSEYHWQGLQWAAGNAFVLAGLAMLALLVVAALRVRASPHPKARTGTPWGARLRSRARLFV